MSMNKGSLFSIAALTAISLSASASTAPKKLTAYTDYIGAGLGKGICSNEDGNSDDAGGTDTNVKTVNDVMGEGVVVAKAAVIGDETSTDNQQQAAASDTSQVGGATLPDTLDLTAAKQDDLGASIDASSTTAMGDPSAGSQAQQV